MKNNLTPILKIFLFCALLFGLAAPIMAQGRSSPTIIRDTEIEKALKEWSVPVIEAADLSPDQINLILVQDRNINAFVAGGPNIFLYTGLIELSDSPGEVIGVIAHELGHIRGGHLVRTRDALENASYESILGTLLGVGVAVLSGDGGAGAVVAQGAQGIAGSRFLKFSRIQESSADQAALDYMERSGLNPKGLVSFMQKLGDQELLPASQQSEYVRTHPLTRNRVAALEAGEDQSRNQGAEFPAEWYDQHARIKAKLKGFITPEQVIWDYDLRDNSVPALYAHSIAAYRLNKKDEAITKIDQLIEREPNNPYFLELKGQMLVDFGQLEPALPYYQKALDIMPEANLIRTAFSHALIESSNKDQSRLDTAIGHLERAARDEPRSSRNYRLLATAYGKKGDNATAQLYLAEEAVLRRDYHYAKRQAETASKGLPENSQLWLRAQDILKYLEQKKLKGN